MSTPSGFPEYPITTPLVRLSQILSLVGGGMVELHSGPAEAASPVYGVTILDLLEPVYPSGHIVLAVGVDPLSPEAVGVVRAAGEAGVVAVVFRKQPGSLPSALSDAASAAGTAVLLRTPWVGWAQFVGVLRAGLAGASVPLEPAASGYALGNLEALADAIGDQVDGAVTIEDVQSRVLAYSSSEDEVDEIRRLTILGRRVPQWRISAMEESGFFRALWASGDVVHRGASDNEPERFVVAVKAGTEILGSIWVATAGMPRPDMAEVLRNCAAAAVPHLLFYRSLHSGLALQVDTAARDLLEGHGSADLLAERAGLSAALPAIVLVVRSEDPRRMDINPRVPELVTLKGSQQGGRPVVVPRESGLCVILTGFRTPAEAQARARTVAESLAEPLGSLLPGRTWISVGTAAASLHGVQDSLRSAELALRALKFSPAGMTVGSAPDLGNEMALVQLRDSLAGADFCRPTPVDRLVSHDGERGDTAMVDTLRAYLDAFGNIPKAARQVGYHPNSFRYRLRKMEEISGIKLDDPDARLLAQIQLRLLQDAEETQQDI